MVYLPRPRMAIIEFACWIMLIPVLAGAWYAVGMGLISLPAPTPQVEQRVEASAPPVADKPAPHRRAVHRRHYASERHHHARVHHVAQRSIKPRNDDPFNYHLTPWAAAQIAKWRRASET